MSDGQASVYEQPAVESFDDREIFGDAPAATTAAVGSETVLHAV